MFGIAAIVTFAVALILGLASVSKGVLLTVTTFTLIGLLCRNDKPARATSTGGIAEGIAARHRLTRTESNGSRSRR